ncbi:MAG: Calx-beta domain-containing protein [Gammaproteobacteria bacterium]
MHLFSLAITVGRRVGRAFFAIFVSLLGSLLVIPCAEAAIAYVQGSATVVVGTNTISATFAGAQTAGNLNVVAIGWADDTTSVSSVTDSRGNVYTLAAGPTRRAGAASSYIYYAKNIVSAGAGANTITATITSASVTWPEIRISEYSGLDTTSPVDVVQGANGSGTSVNTGSFTTTNATDLIFAWVYVQNSITAAGSGYTARTFASGDLVEDRQTTVAGSYSATATMGTSGWWLIQAAAFKAAAAGDTQAPTAPTGLTATAVSSSQITLNWTASTDNVAVTGYRVERCQGVGCSTFAEIATPTGTTFSDTGRAASTSYTYRVRAQDAVPNLSAYSSTSSATTQAAADTQAPSQPMNFSAVTASSTQINLSWTASTDNVAVTGYRVERCQGAGCSTFTQIATPTATTFSDTGLTASTSYTYRVRAQDAVPNLSVYSGTSSATTPATPDTTAPTVPGNPSATAASATQVNLVWTASTDNVGVTGYRVERCQGVGCSTFTQIATPTATTLSDTGLSASTSYSYRVRAQDAVPNLSGYSSIQSATTPGAGDIQAPTAPAGLSATPASSTQVDLSWSASTDNVGVTAYVVERCAVSNCSYATIRTLTGTVFSDLTVSGSTAYTYRVRAKDAANNFSPYSSTANATSGAGMSAVTTSYTYDEGGRLRTVANTGNSTSYTLDAAGNRKTVTTAAAAGSIQLQQATYSTAENGTLNISVSRSVADGGAVSVQYSTADGTATAPGDYTTTSGTLTWPDGDATPKTISIPIATDSILEGNETFTLTLSGPAGGAVLGALTQAAVTILDDDGIGLSVANVSVNENAGSATVTVTKSGTSAVTNSVSYASANGTAVAGSDYTAVSDALTFGAADTTKTIVVPITNDGVYEGNETFTVSLSSPTNGATLVGGPATVTIVEDDLQPVFSINSLAASEGSGFAFTVTRSGSLATSNGVDFATANGTAAAGANYLSNSGTLTFQPGVPSLQIPVTSLSDSLYNNNLTFNVNLSSPTNLATISTGSGTGTIQNTNAAPTFTLSGPVNGAVLEGNPLVYTITKTGASALTHTINYSTGDMTASQGADYTAQSGTLSFAPGSSSSQTISVPTLFEGNGVNEGVESLAFTIGSPGNNASISGPTSLTSSIVDLDSPPPVPTLSGTASRVDPGVSFALNWTTTYGDTHYVLLQNRSVSGGTFSPAPESPVSGNAVVLSRVSSGSYRFEVQACRGSQCSAPSNVKTVLVCLVTNC